MSLRDEVVQTIDEVDPPRLSTLALHALLEDELITTVRSVSGATVILLTDVVLLVTTGEVLNTNITLPPAGIGLRRHFMIKKIDASTGFTGNPQVPHGKITLIPDPLTNDTIEGDATGFEFAIDGSRDCLRVVSDGVTSWWAVGYYQGPTP